MVELVLLRYGGVSLDVFHERFCGFESRNLVFGNDDSGVFSDVAGGFFGAYLDDEAAESTEVDVFAVD